jgi:hypothetical protein
VTEDREAKWSARADEWGRLAGLTTDDHVMKVCASMAEQADRMANFWHKWK